MVMDGWRRWVLSACSDRASCWRPFRCFVYQGTLTLLATGSPCRFFAAASLLDSVDRWRHAGVCISLVVLELKRLDLADYLRAWRAPLITWLGVRGRKHFSPNYFGSGAGFEPCVVTKH